MKKAVKINNVIGVVEERGQLNCSVRVEDDLYCSQNKLADLKRELQQALKKLEGIEVMNQHLWNQYNKMTEMNKDHREEALQMRFERDQALRRNDNLTNTLRYVVEDRAHLAEELQDLRQENEELVERYRNAINNN